MRLVHGTSAEHEAEIRRLGLRQRWEGRGVCWARDTPGGRSYARNAGTVSCIRVRRSHGTHEGTATVLVVSVDPLELEGAWLGPLGTDIVTADVPPALLRFDYLTVKLPPRGFFEAGGDVARSRPVVGATQCLEQARARGAVDLATLQLPAQTPALGAA